MHVYMLGGTSQVLDIGEENKYYFANDGFSMNKGIHYPPTL